MLKATEIDSELNTLKKNQIALQKAGINNTQTLQTFISNQSHHLETWTPQGFIWRPCSFIKKNYPMELFSGDVGVIIGSNTSMSEPAYFYKKNALSSSARHGYFVYKPPKGGFKDKGSIQELGDKMTEMEQRRIGQTPDPNLHYYGLEHLSWNEVLGTYSQADVLGIIVGETPEAAQEALLFRAKLGRPFRPLYQY